jgi:hypothetical protein
MTLPTGPATPPPVPIVRIRRLPAQAGLRWIRQGLRAFVRQPAGFMGLFAMFLLAMLLFSLPVAFLMPLAEAIHLDPVVVSLLSLVLMPLLSLAFMLGTEAVTNDLRVRPALFFLPLRGCAGARRSLLGIGLLYVALFALAWFIGNGIDDGETMRWFSSRFMMPSEGAVAPALPPPLGPGAQIVMFLKMATIAIGSIPLWHAPALVHWARQGVAKAMFASVIGLWRTKAALAVFMLGWLALMFAVTSALAVLELLLGGSTLFLVIGVISSWAMSAVFYVTLWFGFVDTFEIAAPPALRPVMAEHQAQ